MHGTNEIVGPRHADQGLLVKEIFGTIQGEGPWAGYPAVFVRLAGCNLRCHFCDTDFSGGDQMTADEVAQQVVHLSGPAKRVVFTGGEPMLQDLPGIIRAVLKRTAGFAFQIETAGAVWNEDLQKHIGGFSGVSVVCSPKTPKVHPMIVKHAHAWKYILRCGETDPEDGLPNMSTQLPGKPQKLYRPPLHRAPIYVQPCDESPDAEATRRNTELAAGIAMKYGYRLSLQTHKIVGLP